MEKKQSELCMEVLRRFYEAGVLDDFILIGSWCLYFYQDYFSGIPFVGQAAIKTRDIDFLIADPTRVKKKVDLPALLEDMGFVVDFKGTKGYIKLDHPELVVEFLVPERGRGSDKPYPLEKLRINATPLRLLSFLSSNVIRIKADNFHVNVPHPANFALHKLIIFQRRVKEEKAEKDKNMAAEILKALFAKGEEEVVRKVFRDIPASWQKKILEGLEKAGEEEIKFTLQSSNVIRREVAKSPRHKVTRME